MSLKKRYDADSFSRILEMAEHINDKKQDNGSRLVQ